MAHENRTPFVATFGGDAAAAAGDEALKGLGDTAVVTAVVLERDAAGKVDVKEHGGGLVGGGTALGAVGGLVVGLFAGQLMKRHEEKQIGVDAEDWVPAGSSAIVAVVDDLYLDWVDAAVAKAVKKTNKDLDKGDYDAVVRPNEGGQKIVEAVDS